MDESVLQSVVREVMADLVRGDFYGLLARCPGSRLTAAELQRAVREYGRTPVAPPDSAFSSMSTVPVKEARYPTWSVWVPLWTREEGRSDLTLKATVVLGLAAPTITIDDLCVP